MPYQTENSWQWGCQQSKREENRIRKKKERITWTAKFYKTILTGLWLTVLALQGWPHAASQYFLYRQSHVYEYFASLWRRLHSRGDFFGKSDPGIKNRFYYTDGSNLRPLRSRSVGPKRSPQDCALLYVNTWVMSMCTKEYMYISALSQMSGVFPR